MTGVPPLQMQSNTRGIDLSGLTIESRHNLFGFIRGAIENYCQCQKHIFDTSLEVSRFAISTDANAGHSIGVRKPRSLSSCESKKSSI